MCTGCAHGQEHPFTVLLSTPPHLPEPRGRTGTCLLASRPSIPGQYVVLNVTLELADAPRLLLTVTLVGVSVRLIENVPV